MEIGGNVGAGYFPPHWDHHRVGRTLRGMLGEVDIVLGDFNCPEGSKKLTLEDIIAELELDDVCTTQHTHEWGQHKCRIDRVLTKGEGRPWAIKEGWGCLSDHVAIGVRVKLSDGQKLTLTKTDWRKVERYVENERKKREKKVGIRKHEYEYAGQAVEELVRILREEWTRTVNICTRSKRW